jgi:rhodanese-related sulfurtransferase
MKLLEEGKAVLVDVREEKEQKVSMLPGAITEAQLLRSPEKYGDRILIGYCTISYRSGKLAQKLKSMGLSMLNLRGGLLAWVHDGGKSDQNGETWRISSTAENGTWREGLWRSGDMVSLNRERCFDSAGRLKLKFLWLPDNQISNITPVIFAVIPFSSVFHRAAVQAGTERKAPPPYRVLMKYPFASAVGTVTPGPK